MNIKINIKATNIELTEDIKGYIYKKIELLEKYIDSSDVGVMCDVEVGKTTMHHQTGDIFKAEMHLKISGKYIYAVSEKDTLNSALDEVKDEIARSVTSNKKKRESLVRKGGAIVKAMIKGVGYPFRRGGR